MRQSILLLALITILISGCKKEVEGCTDKDGENYNAEATLDNGSCTYARDKFIGSYTGKLECPGSLNLLNGSTTFTIDEDITGGKNSVNVLIKTTSGLIVPVKGTCNGNTLSIDTTVKDVSITLLGSPVVLDVIAKGSVTYSAATKAIAGPLSITAKNAIFNLTDNCIMIGTKG
jgi:hypothetical protein